MGSIEIKGLNPDYDLYQEYLYEFYHGLTDTEDYEEWKEEILSEDDDDIDWELMDMALELAEADEE